MDESPFFVSEGLRSSFLIFTCLLLKLCSPVSLKFEEGFLKKDDDKDKVKIWIPCC